jgi:hypothetical protein
MRFSRGQPPTAQHISSSNTHVVVQKHSKTALFEKQTYRGAEAVQSYSCNNTLYLASGRAKHKRAANTNQV